VCTCVSNRTSPESICFMMKCLCGRDISGVQTQDLISRASSIIESKLVSVFDKASEDFDSTGKEVHRDIMKVGNLLHVCTGHALG